MVSIVPTGSHLDGRRDRCLQPPPPPKKRIKRGTYAPLQIREITPRPTKDAGPGQLHNGECEYYASKEAPTAALGAPVL